MRILLVAQVFPPRRGGSGQWMWELYRRLAAAETVVAAGSCQGADAFDAVAPLDIRRLELDHSSWGVLSPRAFVEFAQSFASLRRLVQTHAPAQIHCAKALPEGLLGSALRATCGVRFICYAHGEELRLAATSRELRALTRHVLHRADRVIANSAFTRRVLTDEWRVPDARVAVVSPGVDTGRFAPAARDRNIRERLGWGDRPVVLTVGTLQKRKGQDMIIRALPAIRAACPDVLYVMAGPDAERAYLEATVAQCDVRDAVQFLNDVSDDELVTCYQQCDLFALANRQIGWDIEGFGMVLVEAQACGRPVLAGRSGGTMDAVDDGISGELIDATSPEPVAAAVTRLLLDRERRESMGRNARAWALKNFDWAPLAADAARIFSNGPKMPLARVQPA